MNRLCLKAFVFALAPIGVYRNIVLPSAAFNLGTTNEKLSRRRFLKQSLGSIKGCPHNRLWS